jgi:hypothetical protein
MALSSLKVGPVTKAAENSPPSWVRPALLRVPSVTCRSILPITEGQLMSSTGPRIDDEQSGTAYGITIFAGVMLATLASFEILQGLSAVLKDDVFVSGLSYTYRLDLTGWGWVHMLIGAIGLAVGIGILMGQVWAFSAGIGFAVLSALAQFAFMPYYPFWSMLIISMDILVVWALAKQISQAP